MFTTEQVDLWRFQALAALETPLPFETWLTHQGRRCVGRAWDINNCPLRNYLHDVLPWLDVRVGLYHIDTELPARLCQQHGWLSPNHQWNWINRLDYFGGYSPHKVPEWATRFMKAIDQEFRLAEVPACRLSDRTIEYSNHKAWITAEDALRVLRQVMQSDQIAV